MSVCNDMLHNMTSPSMIRDDSTQGTATDMNIQVAEILKMKKKLEAIMAGHAGRTPEELAEACDRDNFMSPIEAKEFGLIDHVLTPEEQADLK